MINVNYDMMLRNAKHDLDQAEKDLREFRANSCLSVAVNVRKETLRGMISYRNALFQRVENLKKDMGAGE